MEKLPETTAASLLVEQLCQLGQGFWHCKNENFVSRLNVGEPAAAVQELVDAYKYDRPVVLDPQRQAAKALRVTSLPTSVVIGRDGTIQAAHVGNTAVIRQQIQADLDKLMSGGRLIPSGE